MLTKHKHPYLGNHELWKLPVLTEDNLDEIVAWLELNRNALGEGEVVLETCIDETENDRLYENVLLMNEQGSTSLISGAQGLKRFAEYPQAETQLFFAAPLMLEIIRRLRK
jgi:hypothetical protein